MNNVAWTPAERRVSTHSGFTRHAGEGRTTGRTRFPERATLATPPGWPTSVRPPHAPGWQESAANYLLDCSPPEYRTIPVLRRHVVVLARFTAEHVESQLVACTQGLAGVRTSLGDYVTPDVVEAAAQTWHEQQAFLRRRRREIALVEEALRGGVFVQKL
ncbi:MAG: hypothetical protein ACK5LN_01600 [Propioniciclava sp.]